MGKLQHILFIWLLNLIYLAYGHIYHNWYNITGAFISYNVKIDDLTKYDYYTISKYNGNFKDYQGEELIIKGNRPGDYYFNSNPCHIRFINHPNRFMTNHNNFYPTNRDSCYTLCSLKKSFTSLLLDDVHFTTVKIHRAQFNVKNQNKILYCHGYKFASIKGGGQLDELARLTLNS